MKQPTLAAVAPGYESASMVTFLPKYPGLPFWGLWGSQGLSWHRPGDRGGHLHASVLSLRIHHLQDCLPSGGRFPPRPKFQDRRFIRRAFPA